MAIRILHIDTSGPVGMVMVGLDGKPVNHKIFEGERNHAGKLNGLVDELLSEVKLELGDLDALAVCNGPGSYTGLRIGLATAKGYCYVLEKPLILQNRLCLMLEELRAKNPGDEHSAKNSLAIIPARAGEYYVAAEGAFMTPPRHMTTPELAAVYMDVRYLNIVGAKGTDLDFLPADNILPHHDLDTFVWGGNTLALFIKNDFADLAYSEPEYLKSAYITASRADR